MMKHACPERKGVGFTMWCIIFPMSFHAFFFLLSCLDKLSDNAPASKASQAAAAASTMLHSRGSGMGHGASKAWFVARLYMGECLGYVSQALAGVVQRGCCSDLVLLWCHSCPTVCRQVIPMSLAPRLMESPHPLQELLKGCLCSKFWLNSGLFPICIS